MTLDDLKEMSFVSLVNILLSSVENKEQKATQDDIDKFLKLDIVLEKLKKLGIIQKGNFMAKKNATVFVCNNCGYESSKWLGKCPACNEWNSFFEEKVQIKMD